LNKTCITNDVAGQLIEQANVPKDVWEEAGEKAKQVEMQSPGYGNLYRLAFIMNSNPRNLWEGDSKENSTINSMRTAIDALNKETTREGLQGKAKEFISRADKLPPGAVKDGYNLAAELILNRLDKGLKPTDAKGVLCDDYECNLVDTVDTMLEFDVHSDVAINKALASSLHEVFQTFYQVANDGNVHCETQKQCVMTMLVYEVAPSQPDEDATIVPQSVKRQLDEAEESSTKRQKTET